MMQEKQDIAVRIGAAAALDQLAEESAELTHAALKLARIWRGVIEARKLARWKERLETAGGEAAGNDIDA